MCFFHIKISQFPDQRYCGVIFPKLGSFVQTWHSTASCLGSHMTVGLLSSCLFLGLFVYLCAFCIFGLARLKWTVALGCRQKTDSLCRQHTDEYQSELLPHHWEFTLALTGSNKRQQGLHAMMNSMGGNGCSSQLKTGMKYSYRRTSIITWGSSGCTYDTATYYKTGPPMELYTETGSLLTKQGV